MDDEISSGSTGLHQNIESSKATVLKILKATDPERYKDLKESDLTFVGDDRQTQEDLQEWARLEREH